MDKDVLRQNRGAQQGNVHHDSDQGLNPDGKQGSTLHKGEEDDQRFAQGNDKTQETESARQENLNSDTLGIP